jgi:hypothetical protein
MEQDEPWEHGDFWYGRDEGSYTWHLIDDEECHDIDRKRALCGFQPRGNWVGLTPKWAMTQPALCRHCNRRYNTPRDRTA